MKFFQWFGFKKIWPSDFNLNNTDKSIQTDIFCFDDKLARKAFEINDLCTTNHLPKSIYCPITRMPMQDPVIAADGHSYERSEFNRWISKKKRSPVTGEYIDEFVIPNHNLRCTIGELINDHVYECQ